MPAYYFNVLQRKTSDKLYDFTQKYRAVKIPKGFTTYS